MAVRLTSPDPDGGGIERRRIASIAARGALVTMSGQLGRIGLQMLTIAVLARLLNPKDYGLVAMVTGVVGLAEIFRDFGLSAAAVQSASLSRTQRDNLFWANSGLGALMALLGFAVSEPLGAFFRQPEVPAIMRAIAITFLLNGMATQYRASLTRSMRFGGLVVVDVSAQVLGLAVGVALALSGASYWALVAMQLCQSAGAFAMAAVVSRWVPGWPRRTSDMRSFWRFGWHLVGTQVLSYASNNIDTIVIGRRLGAGPLGYYDRAYRLLAVPLAQLRTPTTTVALPVLSNLADRNEEFGRFLVVGQVALGYTIVAALTLGAAAADPLVEVFLGPQWPDAAGIFALLAIGGALDTLAYVGYWAYLSRALTHRLLSFTVASAIVRILAIIVGVNWGVLGVAWGYVIARGILWPISLYWLSRSTAVPLRSLMSGGARIVGVSVGCGVFVRILLDVLPPASGPIVALILAVLAALAFHGLLSLALPVVHRDHLALARVLRRVRTRA